MIRCHHSAPSGPRTKAAVPVASETAVGFDVTEPPSGTVGCGMLPATCCQLKPLPAFRPNTSIQAPAVATRSTDLEPSPFGSWPTPGRRTSCPRRRGRRSS